MKCKILLLQLLFLCATARSQVIIINNPISDSIFYAANNYLPLGIAQQQNNNTYSVIYSFITDSSYKMKKVYLDSAQTKLLSKVFYHQGKLHGPFEAYQQGNIQAKGRYKEGKLHEEKKTYYSNGTVYEKASYQNGIKTGVWEYYKINGALMRRITYGSNGIMLQEQFF